ncbi:hypothetical protein F4861DRAFT_502607 [Xylaria intraflava]|nr:hypothetical protein F4861DRAFT_502607 [Xylaria intraflava]
MCIETYALYNDIECQHAVYQNTWVCDTAARRRAGEENLLRETVFLPARPPNLPPGFFGCRTLRATRPVAGKCPSCIRAQLAAARARAINNDRDNNDKGKGTDTINSDNHAARARMTK